MDNRHSTKVVNLVRASINGTGDHPNSQHEDVTQDFSSPLAEPLQTEAFSPNQHEADYDENDVDIQDARQFPRQTPQKIEWPMLNQNFDSTPFVAKEVELVARENAQKMLDLRPYMIERPYLVT